MTVELNKKEKVPLKFEGCDFPSEPQHLLLDYQPPVAQMQEISVSANLLQVKKCLDKPGVGLQEIVELK